MNGQFLTVFGKKWAIYFLIYRLGFLQKLDKSEEHIFWKTGTFGRMNFFQLKSFVNLPTCNSLRVLEWQEQKVLYNLNLSAYSRNVSPILYNTSYKITYKITKLHIKLQNYTNIYSQFTIRFVVRGNL